MTRPILARFATHRPPMRRLALLPLLLAFLLAALAAPQAQQSPGQRIEAIRGEITQLGREIESNFGDSAALAQLRGRVEPIAERLRAIIAENQPQIDAARARIERLGPPPDAARNETEAPEVAREREEQTRALREAEALTALARNQLAALEQFGARIIDQRRALLARALLERSSSILNPALWADVARALPAEWRSVDFLVTTWLNHARRQLDVAKATILAAAALLLLFVAIPGQRYLRRFENRPAWPPADHPADRPPPKPPTRQARALAALRVTLIWALIPLIVAAGLYNLLDALNLLTPRIADVARTVLFGAAFVAFAHGLAEGLLDPDKPGWRLIAVDDHTARRISNLAKTFTAVIVVGKVVEAFNKAIYAALPVTVATQGVVALVGAIIILRTLRRLRARRDDEGDARDPDEEGLHPGLRLAAWIAALALLAAPAFGYIALASFLQDQIVWLAILAGLLAILVALTDEYVGRGLSPDGAAGRQIMNQIGLARSSLKQISILSSGLIRVALIVAAAMLALAPWGLDGGDTLGALRAALFGFTVGGVTISISNILLALLFFALGFGATKAVKGWLERTYLPHTKLDVGLRNSIATMVGYVGVIVAAIMAASTLGLSLDRLTIVAGALSVGIGFGLQSIVNNFVSGLILLWERPIRAGDWIVVGTEQGIVKRINVRSTVIETFDRASLIVPNAQFISGNVKNWMHNDRTARISIPVRVAYGSDPERVRKALLAVAGDNPNVFREPPARVFFMQLGETHMEFELRCFVDVDATLGVRSELLFAIHKALTADGIEITAANRMLVPPREAAADDSPPIASPEPAAKPEPAKAAKTRGRRTPDA